MTKKALETGGVKIQKICDALRKETLEPAQKEAEQIIAIAEQHAEKIVSDARKEAAEIIAHGKKMIEQERHIFLSALTQGSKLALESLKQSIMNELFQHSLAEILEKQTSDPQLIAKLIQSIILSIDKEGITTDISAIIPQAVSIKEVNALLSKDVLSRLREGSVILGDFGGGAQVKLHNKNITLDITEITLKQLVASYVRKDFRKMILQA